MIKNKKLEAILFIFIALLISNCSSSDGDLGGNGEFIVASVEGFEFESSRTVDTTSASKIEGSQFVTLIIQGFDNDGIAIVLSISEYDGPGIYNDAGGDTLGQFSTRDNVWSTAAGDGSSIRITVDSDDDQETTGTFEFLGLEINDESNSRTVTNGAFQVNFQ